MDLSNTLIRDELVRQQFVRTVDRRGGATQRSIEDCKVVKQVGIDAFHQDGLFINNDNCSAMDFCMSCT